MNATTYVVEKRVHDRRRWTRKEVFRHQHLSCPRSTAPPYRYFVRGYFTLCYLTNYHLPHQSMPFAPHPRVAIKIRRLLHGYISNILPTESLNLLGATLSKSQPERR